MFYILKFLKVSTGKDKTLTFKAEILGATLIISSEQTDNNILPFMTEVAIHV